MRYILLIVVFCIQLLSCSETNSKQKELELKERELALKEKEFALKEKDSTNLKSTIQNLLKVM